MNKMFKRVAVMALGVMVFGVAVLPVLTGAQANETGNGFRVSPVRSELMIEKGSSETLNVTVENPTDANVIARAVVNDFVASENEDGEPRLILDEDTPAPKNSFKSLVGSLPDVQLGPREKKELPVTITIPENANAGGYYGAVRFVPASSSDSGNVALTASVGSIVLVRVPGDLTERLNLVELGAAKVGGNVMSFLTSGDVQVITRLKNTGDIHVQPFGKVQVKNMFGKVVQEFELNANEPRANILPESTRRFEDKLNKPKGGWIGRYTITANIGYSQGSGDLISTTASFWYVPMWAVAALFVLLAAIIGAIFWFKSKSGSSHARRP